MGEERFDEEEIIDAEKETKIEKRVRIAVITVGIIFALGFVSFLGYNAYKDISKNVDDLEYSISLGKASDTIREGTVVDKIINNGRTVSGGGAGVFYSGEGVGVGYSPSAGTKGYKPIEYIIVVENDCEYKGERYVGTKEFMVSEDIYNSYKMGDWFDSRDLTAHTITTDSEVKE